MRNNSPIETTETVVELLEQVKVLGKKYRRLTGRPLGCTGEIAEHEAARLLGLELAPVRQAGFDARRQTPDGLQRLQIKGRCVLPGARPSQRIGRLDCRKDWDAVLLVLLDENFDATEIYEADRATVIAALQTPGSRSRNERNQLGVGKFKAIGRRIWKR